MQWDSALSVLLLAAHLGAAETTRALDLDAKSSSLLNILDSPLHCTTEGNSSDQLVTDALGDERRIELRLLDLLDVQLDAVGQSGDLLELLLEAVGLSTTTTDDDTGPSRVDVYADPVTGALYLDTTHGGGLELSGQVVPDLPVLNHQLLVVPVCEPTGLPVRGDSESEAVGVYLLAH